MNKRNLTMLLALVTLGLGACSNRSDLTNPSSQESSGATTPSSPSSDTSIPNGAVSEEEFKRAVEERGRVAGTTQYKQVVATSLISEVRGDPVTYDVTWNGNDPTFVENGNSNNPNKRVISAKLEGTGVLSVSNVPSGISGELGIDYTYYLGSSFKIVGEVQVQGQVTSTQTEEWNSDLLLITSQSENPFSTIDYSFTWSQ